MNNNQVYRQQPIMADKNSKLYRVRVGMKNSTWDNEYYNYNVSAVRALIIVRNEIGGNYQQVKSVELLVDNEWIRQRV